MHKPELLAPAGNLEKLKVALIYGADAVYMSGKCFGLRAFSDNFSLEELKEGIAFAHSLGKKAYVTVNIYPHNQDLAGIPEYLRYLAEINADAIIVSDPGVFRLAKKIAPELKLHISTQANTVNWEAALFWQELGAERIVLAREISINDIMLIKKKTNLQLEAFVHGAMCISYSGRCLLSNYLTARDANRGECSQPCRWKYFVMEETRPGVYFPIVEDNSGTYIFNSKDLCLIGNIPELINAGLYSFKIEGRMKSVHYVATVVNTYRQALDKYLSDSANYQADFGANLTKWRQELEKVSHRQYTTGFYFDKSCKETQIGTQIYSSSSYEQTHDFVGLVKEYDEAASRAVVEQRNNLKLGDKIEIMQPGKDNFTQIITEMADADGIPLEVAPHPRQIFSMPLTQAAAPYAIIRRQRLLNEKI